MLTMAKVQKKIKRSQASLTGGFIVGLAVVALGMLIAKELGWQQGFIPWTISLVIGTMMGVWVRVADL